MDNNKIKELINQLARYDYQNMSGSDFLLTWDKTDHEIHATFLVAEILRGLRNNNISTRIFDSGIGISLFRDQSTRTRFSFAGACNLLGLTVNDLDEGKSQMGIPFFSRIPLLGWIFKYEKKTLVKEDLLIFISPKVLKDWV